MDFVYQLLTAVLVAAVPVLTGFLCNMIHKKAQEIAEKTEDERISALVHEIDAAVRSAVSYVNQTFVEALKKDNVFGEDEEYAKAAFEEAYNTTIETLSSAAIDYIMETFGDLQKYLTVKIEEQVRWEKQGF